MAHYGGEFVRFVSDAGVVTDCDSSFSADGFQPNFVRTVGREVILVPLDLQSCTDEDLRKSRAEIAIVKNTSESRGSLKKHRLFDLEVLKP